MAAYKIYFKNSVQKDFNPIPKKDIKTILGRIKALSENPRPPACEKLTGEERYRLRQGRYRILYSIQDDELTIWVVTIGHRNSNMKPLNYLKKISRKARKEKKKEKSNYIKTS